MFEINHCQQGSEEWEQLRYGRITASDFGKIITKTGKLSSSWEELVNKKVALQILGGVDEGFESDAMVRGASLEHEALEFFNFTYGYNFKKVGFLDSSLGFGCSPDGLDEKNKMGLELKCPLSHTHVNYLCGGKLPDAYKQQVQGSLLVSGYDTWVFGSYHPQLPGLHVIVERDEPYIAKMDEYLTMACEEMKIRLEKIKNMGLENVKA